jgi:hypothetical protein
MTQDSQLLQMVQELTNGNYSNFNYADFKNDVHMCTIENTAKLCKGTLEAV